MAMHVSLAVQPQNALGHAVWAGPTF